MTLVSGFFSKLFLAFALPFIIFYVGVPLLIYVVPYVMHHLFFLHLVRNPFTEYTNLTAHGVRSLGRNFYLDVAAPSVTEISGATDERVVTGAARIGVWHILPATRSRNLRAEYNGANEPLSDVELEALMAAGSESILIYFHGNSFDRTTEHRCTLYNILSEMDFHVLAIDYRGYGDSQGIPSEDGLAADARAIVAYARRVAPTKSVVVWGHSMGTGVATRAVAELSDVSAPPDAMVLEAPFNNLREVIRGHPLSKALRVLPWFDKLIVDPLKASGLVMASDERIQRITCPILVMHAVDDHIIPVELARRLVAAARGAGRRIKYVEFESDYAFKHKFIHRHEGLPQLIGDFVAEAQLHHKRAVHHHADSGAGSHNNNHIDGDAAGGKKHQD